MSEIWINDVDLANYGFVLGADPKQGSAPALRDAVAPLLGQIGPTWLGEPVQGSARSMLVAGHVVGTTASDYRSKVDQIKGLVASGAVRIRFADRTTQEFRDARLNTCDVTPRAAILSALAGDVAMTFEVADPLRYDVQPQGLAFGVSRVALPIGTAPSFPLIYVNAGGSTQDDPIISIRNAAGDVVQTMGFDGSLTDDDFLRIDCARALITKSIAGVESDALSWWVSGDFPVIRPTDGNYELAEYPTIEVTASGGSPNLAVGLITYARAWL